MEEEFNWEDHPELIEDFLTNKNKYIDIASRVNSLLGLIELKGKLEGAPMPEDSPFAFLSIDKQFKEKSWGPRAKLETLTLLMSEPLALDILSQYILNNFTEHNGYEIEELLALYNAMPLDKALPNTVESIINTLNGIRLSIYFGKLYKYLLRFLNSSANRKQVIQYITTSLGDDFSIRESMIMWLGHSQIEELIPLLQMLADPKEYDTNIDFMKILKQERQGIITLWHKEITNGLGPNNKRAILKSIADQNRRVQAGAKSRLDEWSR